MPMKIEIQDKNNALLLSPTPVAKKRPALASSMFYDDGPNEYVSIYK